LEYGKRSLQGKINLAFLVVVMISIISFMIISINQTRTAVQNTSTQYTLQLIDMVNENIDSYIVNMENLAKIVVNNSDVRNYLFAQTDEITRRDVYGEDVEKEFRTLLQTRNDIYNIGIIGPDNRYLINNRMTQINPNAQLTDMSWYCDALEGKEVISSSHVQNIVFNRYPWVVTLSEGISNPVNGGENGVFFVDLNYSSISKLCEDINLGNKGYVFILDKDGNLVYHPKQQLIYSGLWDEEIDTVENAKATNVFSKDGTKMYTISKSKSTGWTIVGVTYLSEMLSGMEKSKTMYLLMAVVLIGVAMMLALLIADMITMPLRRLRESMEKAETGDFQAEMEETGTEDEIGVLIGAFNMMIRRIRELIRRNNEEQEEKRRSELNALQAQINPHFLYNTLDSIIWMAEGGNTKDVVLMTSSLAKLLRKSISNKKELVTLGEEIDYTRSYLTIQKMRYKDKLEFTIDVSPDIRECTVIKLIVQPLVENAIYHGIKTKEGGGTVRIEGEYEGDEIVLRVIDDGMGMSQEQLRHIFDEREIDTSHHGVGVLNVQRRIQLYYGEEYGLTYTSIEGRGTVASIHIPDCAACERREEEDAEKGVKAHE
jgi:two-component system sensor histidine kinase YesM